MKKSILTVLIALMVLALCASCGAAPPEPMSVKSLTSESADVAANDAAAAGDADGAADAGGSQLNSMPEMKPAAAPPTVSTTVETSSEDTSEELSTTQTTETETTTESTGAATTDNDASTSTTSDVQPTTTETSGTYIVTEHRKVPSEDHDWRREVDEYGDEWVYRNTWELDAVILQEEDIGALQGHPGMYVDYQFDIRMTYGLRNTEDLVRVVGDYEFGLRSVIRINSDEMADRLASEILGSEVSGLGLGATVELTGLYESWIPYYIDDNGIPVTPPYDEEAGGYVFPEGKENASQYDAFCHRIPDGWESCIKDKNRQIVQPAKGSYLIFESFVMEYIGSTYHIMTGSIDEDTVYNVYFFVVIEPGSLPTIDSGDTLGAKVYINLKTSEYHDIWLEGVGTLYIKEQIGKVVYENP